MTEPDEILFTSKLPPGEYEPQPVPVDGSLIEGNRFEGEAEKPSKTVMNEQKKRFIEHYLINGNATRSAILAGYSEDSAHSQGSRLLKDAKVQAILSKKKEKLLEELHINQQDVLKGFHEIATNFEAKDSDKINAWDKLARHINFYEVEKKTEAKKEITITYTTEKD